MKAWEATVRKTQAVARKRANSIFGTHSISHAAADEHDNDAAVAEKPRKSSSASETYQAEKVLPNGDYYSGQWFENFPHGTGRYLWTDGCMYIGDWYRGKSMGRGRFSWPSGATYDGEFKTGFMDGKGTYTTPAGDTYTGHWVMNLQHGDGLKKYQNGDSYDGEWRRGVQEGEGKYQWSNGNSYSGHWRNGSMSGQGTFSWTDGRVFNGHWDDSFPSGQGTLTWPDGGSYAATWSRDPAEMTGTYSPPESGGPGEGADWDPHQLYETDLSESKVRPGDRVLIWPSQKKLAMWNSTKARESNPRRLSVDGRVSVGIERPVDRMRMWESDGDCDVAERTSNAMAGLEEELMGLRLEDPKFSPGLQIRVPKVVKRQGETISKGHKNYDLMLNLQLGIRHSVGRPAPAASLDLKASAFDPREKVWTRFPPEGTKNTPPHSSCEFKWKDYCPLVFRTLRKLFKVDPADYMLSICGNEALRELSSPGKSGSFFYLTNDDRYMIKTMKKAEVKVLIRMLSAYYNHFRAFENTLLIKFFGLHCVKLTGAIQKKVRFIIMGNLFCSEYTIHRRFDLKGSSLGRMTDKPESEISGTTILKDLDLNFIFRLQKSWFQEFSRQIDRDCEFLEQERIMDYSLLVGLHFRDVSENGELIPSPGETESQPAPPASRADADQLLLDPSRWASIRLGINLPARAERTIRRNDCEFQLVGEASGELYEVVMFFGVIDILQDYDISKKLEHAYKSIHYDPTSISAVDPKLYSKRFRDFIYRVFVEE